MNKPNECPHQNQLRGDLPPLTDRLAKLPIDSRGWPVPAFVQWLEIIDGKPVARPPGIGYPEFRIASAKHLMRCIQFESCWVCGEKLGRHRAFVIGPMCAINLISAEPPSHIDCAEWSVRGCPFLSKPQMKRREDEMITQAKRSPAGEMIERNPGVTLLWHTIEPARLMRDSAGGVLFRVPPPFSLRFFKEGRPATLPEIIESLDSGLPTLLDKAESASEKLEIHQRRDQFVASLAQAFGGTPHVS